MPVIVGQQTKISDLQTQLLDGSRVKDNVRGFKDKDGSIILYTKPGHGGLRGALDHVTSSKSRALAREGIRQVFENEARGKGAAMTDTVRKALDVGFARDVKAGALSLLAGAGKASSGSGPGNGLLPEGLSSKTLGVPPDVVADVVGTAAQVLTADADGTLKRQVAEDLGRSLGQAIMDRSPTAGARDAFSLSSGTSFKNEIKDALAGHGAGGDAQFLQDAFDAACGVVAHNHVDGDGLLRVGSEVYKRGDQLGKGGSGTEVYAYVNVDPAKAHDRLAVKIALDEDDYPLQNALLSEAATHGALSQDGNPNILASKGGVRMGSASFGLIMELCPLGDMEDGIASLDRAAKEGTITAEEALDAKITLLHDAMSGVAHLDEKEFAHRDIKPLNVFIAADGTGKLADFGESKTRNEFRWQDGSGMSPFYIAPEFYGINADEKAIGTALGVQYDLRNEKLTARSGAPTGASSGVSPMRLASEALLREQMPGLSAQERKQLLSEHAKAFKDDALSPKLQPQKRDAFAMGVTGYMALYGKVPGQGADFNQFYDALRSDRDSTLIADPTSARDALPGKVDDGVADRAALLADLTNRLAAPDPKNRLDIRGGLDHGVFDHLRGGDDGRIRGIIRNVLAEGMVRKADERAARDLAIQISEAFYAQPADGAAAAPGTG